MNASPSMAYTTTNDRIMKASLIHDVINIVMSPSGFPECVIFYIQNCICEFCEPHNVLTHVLYSMKWNKTPPKEALGKFDVLWVVKWTYICVWCVCIKLKIGHLHALSISGILITQKRYNVWCVCGVCVWCVCVWCVCVVCVCGVCVCVVCVCGVCVCGVCVCVWCVCVVCVCVWCVCVCVCGVCLYLWAAMMRSWHWLRRGRER